MRRFCAIVKATVLETTSEPLAFLLAISAVAVTTLASAFHIHQFGESSRMARDASLSSSLVFGLLYVVFCTVKAFRREAESGTMQMALSHSVSRFCFLSAKTVGVFAAYLAFAATMYGASVTTVAGAEIGGRIAARDGSLALIWGPAVAADAATIVVPLVAAAVLNRFARFRFVATATWLALAVSLFGAALCVAFAPGDGIGDTAAALPAALAPAAVLLAFPAAVFAAASAAFAVRLRDNMAAACSLAAAAAFLPALGNYYLSDALSGAGRIPWSYVAAAFAATLPLVAAFVVLGAWLLAGRDVG